MPKAKPLPPLEELEHLLDYDPQTGIFKWKVWRGRPSAGRKAGCYKSRYIYIRINKQDLLAHRIAWYLLNKKDPGSSSVDHINGNPSDNRACNLRIGTHSENLRNRGAQANNKSGYKGVAFRKDTKKWTARITVNSHTVNLGCFSTPELAHMAYCKAAAELHGEFARGQ